MQGVFSQIREINFDRETSSGQNYHFTKCDLGDTYGYVLAPNGNQTYFGAPLVSSFFEIDHTQGISYDNLKAICNGGGAATTSTSVPTAGGGGGTNGNGTDGTTSNPNGIGGTGGDSISGHDGGGTGSVSGGTGDFYGGRYNLIPISSIFEGDGQGGNGNANNRYAYGGGAGGYGRGGDANNDPGYGGGNYAHISAGEGIVVLYYHNEEI